MDRIYAQGKTDAAKYFVANEVEHTPLYGLRTLFVVGLQPVEEIVAKAKEHNCKAVYFGTGTSFLPKGFDDWETYDAWDKMILGVIENDLWATLDFDMKHSEGVLEMGCVGHRRFVPMISLKIPYLKLFNYNATVKFDDIDFDKTNPGVWCWNLSDLLTRDHFTDWEDYRNDTIIEERKTNEEERNS